MKAVKIAIIGAGSGEFSMGIVRDLCLTPSLWGSTVAFMDIDPQRLEAVFDVASRYIREMQVNLRFEKTLDRRQALQNADFVINSAMVGGWKRFQHTKQTSRKHGYSQIVFYDNYYQYRLFLDIIRDMEAVCPQAWYIQLANPVFEGCTLVTRQSSIKSVGLCHGFYYGIQKIAQVLGLNAEKVEAQAYGLNHNIWLNKFYVEGVNAYPLLDEWVSQQAGQYWASAECPPSDDLGPKAVDLYRRLGRFPIGDTVTPGGDSYHRWYHYNRATEEKWKEDPDGWYEQHFQEVARSVQTFTDLYQHPEKSAVSVYPPTRTIEKTIDLIDAIANDRPTIMQVNIPNRGCIPGIPDDVVVELPALVSAAGIQGLHLDPLPAPIRFQLQERILLMERDLHAFLSRSRQMLLEYVLSYPQTNTLEQAQALLEDVLNDPFNREMAEYYQ